uniref:(California timema) hypothetical protein n=1 Tax=Timema californicum TaxID=61474 RepID=A0A7R9P2D0_TIMCA|nr:unnamed protein product [Timema californicum]
MKCTMGHALFHKSGEYFIQTGEAMGHALFHKSGRPIDNTQLVSIKSDLTYSYVKINYLPRARLISFADLVWTMGRLLRTIVLDSSVRCIHPNEIRTSISSSSAVELNMTRALANYATEAGVEGEDMLSPDGDIGDFGELDPDDLPFLSLMAVPFKPPVRVGAVSFYVLRRYDWCLSSLDTNLIGLVEERDQRIMDSMQQQRRQIERDQRVVEEEVYGRADARKWGVNEIRGEPDVDDGVDVGETPLLEWGCDATDEDVVGVKFLMSDDEAVIVVELGSSGCARRSCWSYVPSVPGPSEETRTTLPHHDRTSLGLHCLALASASWSLPDDWLLEEKITE